jgi:hypothetical protein
MNKKKKKGVDLLAVIKMQSITEGGGVHDSVKMNATGAMKSQGMLITVTINVTRVILYVRLS